MKFKNKKMSLFIALSLFAFLPLKANAAELFINGSSSGNTGTYTVKYSKSAEDTDTKITFDISNSKNNITPSATTNLANSNCALDGTSCTITLPEGNGTSFTIATITIKNETENDITNNSLSVIMNGVAKTIDGINLSAGKKVEPKSSESTLSGINLSAGSMTPVFNPSTLAYTITGIKDTINSVVVTPICTNNCSWSLSCPTGECSVSSTKKVTLQTGANTLNINVTSEDNSSNKTYVLTIYRGEIETASAYLSSLKIQGIKISPSFDSLTNDYTATVASDIKDLNITTVAEDTEAKIEIKGNKNLKVGDNTITVTVTSSDEKNIQVYTIKVTKEEEKTTTKVATTKVKKKKNYTVLIIILSILVVGIIIGLFLFIKNKKNKNKKNNKNDKNNGNNEKKEEKPIEAEVIDTTTGDLLDELGVEEETKEIKKNNDYLDEEDPKTDVDDALDDLMQTKKIELGDLNF